MDLNFYSTKSRPYGCFSNFELAPITINGVEWPTSEHYFQAQKFVGTDPDYVEEIRRASQPGTAAKMGRQRSHPLRPDWESVKDDIMREAVMAKFTQHVDLMQVLLETGDRKLIEHTKNDRYWADAGDGSGKNMLGIILMETREKLREGVSHEGDDGKAPV